ncbi:ATP-binding protein [Trebonia kvetii]|nr:NB-ARC domain-containing protein [Trebonia kvetii]
MTGRFPRDGHADFVGRHEELARIGELLADSRLVTIAGPGGVGKTRIARSAASQAAGRYPDGPWIVELSGLRDPALLPNTVASVLGLPEQDPRSALQSVLEYLKDRRLLLILDTCEHLLDACAALSSAVLRAAPSVTVLTTTRQPLDMPDEQVFPVGPLPVPGHAVDLFELRAAAVIDGFAVTEQNAPDVIRLCQRLDGIPLAIELAAVRLRELPLPDLVRRLDRRFALLTGGQPGALPRHQTLRTAIEWSHELCSPAERRLWARLSVFAGTFSLAAAEEVCAEVSLERPDVVSALVGLVDKSVVIREDERYRMLDTLREFGAQRLAESGELASCRERHIARYLAMAQYFGGHFADDDQMDRYHELRETHPNLRAALEYALELDDEAPEADEAGSWQAMAAVASASVVTSVAAQERWRSGADLACSLHGYWQISGLLGEGGYWLTKTLDRFTDPGPERARALVNRGFLRSFMGDIGSALADCEAGTAMAVALGDDAVTARGYQHTMLTLTFLGRHDEAAQVAKEARARLRACGDLAGELMLMAQLGHLHQLSGKPDECVAVCDEGLAMLGPDNREQWISTYLHVVSGFALFQMPGREVECEAALRRALYGKQELGDVIGMAYALDVLGWLSVKTGSPARTAWLLGAAEPLWERGGSVRFSGTAIMEELHQQAERSAREALGVSDYAVSFAAGTWYVRERLNAGPGGGALRLEIP